MSSSHEIETTMTAIPVALVEESATPPHLSVVDPDVEVFVPLAPVPDRVKAWTTGVAMPWLKKVSTPPDIVTQDQPSLKKVYDYGRHGQQVPDEGLLRTLARAWSIFALYHTVRAYTRVWLMKSPTRVVVSVVLLASIAVVPEGRQVLTWLLWPAHLVMSWLTNFS